MLKKEVESTTHKPCRRIPAPQPHSFLTLVICIFFLIPLYPAGVSSKGGWGSTVSNHFCRGGRGVEGSIVMVLSSLGHIGGENDDGDDDDGDLEDKKEMVEIVMRERGVCRYPTGPTYRWAGN